MHEIATALNKAEDQGIKARLKSELLAGGELMGLLQQDPEDWFRWQPQDEAGLTDAQINALIEERTQARGNKDFQRADAIRDQLVDAGIELEDSPAGTRWRRT